MNGNSKKLHGTIKWFNVDKGYGFIVPSDGGKDVFVHVRSLEKSGVDPDEIKENDRVSYDLVEFGGKMSASNIEIIG